MIYILDAAALLNGEGFSFEKRDSYFTTSKVLAEWRDFRSRALAGNALASGLLTLQDPCPLSIQKTMEKAEESGTELGDADVSIVALASEFASRGTKFIVVTDDHSVQNVLKKMRVKFTGVAHNEIRKHRVFRRRKNN